MSGMGKPDEEADNAEAFRENAIAVARMMLPRGESSLVCLDCGDPIPEARRLAQKGCKYCITCQPHHDARPSINVVTKML